MIDMTTSSGFEAKVVSFTLFGEPAEEIDFDSKFSDTFKPAILMESNLTMTITCDPDIDIDKLLPKSDSFVITYPALTVPYWDLGFRHNTYFKRKHRLKSVIKYPNYTKRGYKRLVNEPKYRYYPSYQLEFEGYISKAEDGTIEVRGWKV